MCSIIILIQACPSFPSYTFILFGVGLENGTQSQKILSYKQVHTSASTSLCSLVLWYLWMLREMGNLDKFCSVISFLFALLTVALLEKPHYTRQRWSDTFSAEMCDKKICVIMQRKWHSRWLSVLDFIFLGKLWSYDGGGGRHNAVLATLTAYLLTFNF